MRRKDLIKHISELIGTLNEREKRQILSGFLKTEAKGMPISVFKAKLSSLEIIVKYLKEIEKKSFKDISKLLNRKLSTIYNTYSKSKIKFKGNLDVSDTSILIPYEIFSKRKYSILESIVYYLKSDKKFSLIEISFMLNKSYSTVKTVYRRFKNKNEK